MGGIPSMTGGGSKSGDSGNGSSWGMGNGWNINIGAGSVNADAAGSLGGLLPYVLLAGAAWLLLKR